MSLVGILLVLLALAIFLAVAWQIIAVMPPPMQQWARIIVIVVCGIIAIVVLLNMAGIGSGVNLTRPLR
jgi:uncharacterized protein involved in cysteine biosynthesis